MVKNSSMAPIGVFDSGVGGLTVVRAITDLIPNEKIIYFGDTAHLPYGDKSTAAIQAYSVKICDLLLRHHCKVILIACNSASAAAFDLVKEYVGSRSHVLNVIDPVIDYLREDYTNKQIGLIGTKQTVFSNIYKKKIDALDAGIELKSLATPLLVPMIEEGIASQKICESMIHDYLSRQELSDISALILGCTHYPLIKKQISDFYLGAVEIIDSSEIVAKALKGFLEFHNLLNKSSDADMHCFVSDYTEAFTALTKLFFKRKVKLEHYPLWE
ncbi:MAG: glutamate racemase [Pseudomonadota bacterium]